jgi:hypothetical protein
MGPSRLAASAALALLAGAAAAGDFKPADYAYRAPLLIDGRSALYVVSLPPEVYRVATRADLGDLVVVNGLDEIVPFALRRPAPQPEATTAPVALPLFPLQGPGNLPGEALRLRLRSGTTSVDIDQPAVAAPARAPAAYLLDVRGVAEPLRRLHLAWSADAPDFSARLTIEASDDLVQWRPVATSAAVAYLHFGGQAFERADIDVPGVRVQFLRIAWFGQSAPAALTAVSGELRARRSETARLPVHALGTPAAAGEYEFDLDARLPLDRLNLALPEQNTVADAEFLARSGDGPEWRSVARARLYRLAVAGEPDLANSPIAIGATPARHWKVRVSGAGGGIGQAAPRLEAGWLPDELLFVARGNAPFHLLYGNAAAAPLAVGAAALLDANGALRAEGRPLEAARAVLGPPAELGGHDRLVPVTPAPDWKRWLLWAVLLLGVGMLARMAFKLSRSL